MYKIDKEEYQVDPLKDIDHGGLHNSYLEPKILDNIGHEDMTTVIVYGEQGSGKSSYVLQLMYALYDDWRTVLDHLYYDPLEFFLDVKARDQDKRWKVVLLDDAGVGWSKYRFFTDKDFTRLASSFYQIARSETAGLILTTPNPQELLKSYRNMDCYRIKTSYTDDSWNARRRARIYKQSVGKKGGKNIQFRMEETFDVMLPDPVYEEYSKIRASYRENVLPELIEEIQRMREKQQKQGKKERVVNR